MGAAAWLEPLHEFRVWTAVRSGEARGGEVTGDYPNAWGSERKPRMLASSP